MRPPHQLKAAAVIAAAAAAVVAAGVVFVNSGLVSHPESPVADVRPEPTLIQKTSVGCVSPTIVLTGGINGCAGVLEGMSCPNGPYNETRVVHLRGSSGDYILYVEIDGGYHGPGVYPLSPWKHDGLNEGDDVAKVALREWIGGTLWESFSGSLSIDTSVESGNLDAMLRLTDNAAGSGAPLHLQGPWRCPWTP